MQGRILVSAAEGAEVLGISERLFHELRHRPDFPKAVELTSRCRRFRLEELQAWASGLPAHGPSPEPRALARRWDRAGSEAST